MVIPCKQRDGALLLRTAARTRLPGQGTPIQHGVPIRSIMISDWWSASAAVMSVASCRPNQEFGRSNDPMLNYRPSLGGGMLIGLSAAVLLVADGRIAGISGIVAGLLGRWTAASAWRPAFLLGLLAGPLSYALVTGHLPQVRIVASVPVLVAAGLLVGFGTRLGSGCTSGHGVCGLVRLSPRSFAAVCILMVMAAAVVFVVRHILLGSNLWVSWQLWRACCSGWVWPCRACSTGPDPGLLG